VPETEEKTSDPGTAHAPEQARTATAGLEVTPRIDTVQDVLRLHTRDEGECPALIAGQAQYTYAELNRRVEAFAASLRSLGVGRGAPVGLWCTNRAEWVIAALAIMTLGARVAAFNTWSRRWDLDYLLRESQCEVLVALSSFGDVDLEILLRELVPEAWNGETGWQSTAYPRLHELVLIDTECVPRGARRFTDLTEAADTHRYGESSASSPSRDDVGLVLYTSGSTGRPKAVGLQQGHALEHGYDVGVRMGVRPGDRIWVPVPLFWSYGGANALMVSLVHGACLVLQEVFEPGAALEAIETHQCTVAYTLPNITTALLDDPSFGPSRVSSLERGMTIGSPQAVRSALEGLGITGICNAYGSTEAYGGATVTPYDWPAEVKMSCQGPPLPRVALEIRGEENRVAARGEVGEITLSGQVTRGYVDQPEQNARVFRARGEFQTGDLGYLDDQGNLHFVIRASEMLRVGGINIAPAEVEEFLCTHPQVTDAAVVGVPDELRDQVAIGLVTVSGSDDIEGEDLRAYCREHIASFKIPTMIIVGAEPLPTTDTGKTARDVIRDRAKRAWGDAEQRQA
jgi:fatty-acyl-CoA synthase